MGKNKYIETPEIMWDLFIKYKKHTKDNPRRKMDFKGSDVQTVYFELEVPLTMEGFELYVADMELNQELSHYFSNKDDRYTDYVAICTRIRKEIRNDQIQGGMVGLYNPSITQRLNGLVDRVDNTTNGKEITKEIKVEIVKS